MKILKKYLPEKYLRSKLLHKLNSYNLISDHFKCILPHEVYACGSACQTECATLGQPCPIVNIKCNNDCYCIDGYARNAIGLCIPQNFC